MQSGPRARRGGLRLLVREVLEATPRPAEPESVKKVLSAELTAAHFVVPAPVWSLIDFELSIRK